MEHRVVRLETDMEHMAKSIDSLTVQVTELNESLNRYRGAWGMLLMISGAVTGALALWFRSKG